MDPGRRAMIDKKGPAREAPPRELTAPKFDPFQRISKPRRSPQPPASYSSSSTSTRQPASAQSRSRSKYLTQDEQSEQFVAEEDKFVLRQAKKKADIRVREDRATPIDLLAFQLRYIDPDRDIFDVNDDDAEIDVPSPEQVVDSLKDPQKLAQLAEEITNYHTLEANDRNRAYWKALQAVCAHRRELLGKDGAARGAVGSDVSADVDKILKPKTFEQLVTLEGQIRAKLDSDEDIDVDYWEHLLDRLTLWKAKAQLNAIYQTIKEARIAQLKETNPDLAAHLEAHPDDDAPPPATASQTQAPARTAAPPRSAVTAAPRPSSFAKPSAAPPPGTARFAQVAEEDFSQTTKALFEREVARGVSENEEIFTAEEALPGSSSGAPPKWADKYRPRKPRYFNRVQMGYEWNKYNQTHYDHDNPPPKVVQGYKFNIFYPDLIDKTRAPTYKIIREGGRRRGESFTPAGEADTCLIRFVAGPPYEDIAFRIVDREWDYSAKKDRGFRSTFDKGILQLHFQFKKIFYRK